MFGFVSLIQKAALGLAAAMLGELLGLFGYRANQVQSAPTLDALRAIMLIGGGTFALIAVSVIAFYPLHAQLHARLRRVLAWRGRRLAEKHP